MASVSPASPQVHNASQENSETLHPKPLPRPAHDHAADEPSFVDTLTQWGKGLVSIRPIDTAKAAGEAARDFGVGVQQLGGGLARGTVNLAVETVHIVQDVAGLGAAAVGVRKAPSSFASHTVPALIEMPSKLSRDAKQAGAAVAQMTELTVPAQGPQPQFRQAANLGKPLSPVETLDRAATQAVVDAQPALNLLPQFAVANAGTKTVAAVYAHDMSQAGESAVMPLLLGVGVLGATYFGVRNGLKAAGNTIAEQIKRTGERGVEPLIKSVRDASGDIKNQNVALKSIGAELKRANDRAEEAASKAAKAVESSPQARAAEAKLCVEEGYPPQLLDESVTTPLKTSRTLTVGELESALRVRGGQLEFARDHASWKVGSAKLKQVDALIERYHTFMENLDGSPSFHKLAPTLDAGLDAASQLAWDLRVAKASLFVSR